MIKRSLYIIVIAIVIAFAFLPSFAYAQSDNALAPAAFAPTTQAEASAPSGSGTEVDPYSIASASNLLYVANQVNSGTNYSGQFLVLAADIDLEAAGITSWTPIGDDSKHPFKGTFNGANHTVKGMAVTKSSGYAGLFGYANFAKIRNLNVIGTVTSTSYLAGGIAGDNYYSTIENCSFTGSVSGTHSVGGIAGSNTGTIGGTTGSITACSFNGSVVGTAGTASGESPTGVGGIVGTSTMMGLSNSPTQQQITNAHNTIMVSGCTVSGTVQGTNAVGGIIGATHAGSIKTCRNTASITASGQYIGGIIGYAVFSKTSNYRAATAITECENRGSVTSTATTPNIGGIAGAMNGIVTNCCNSGTVTGTTNIGGIIGILANLPSRPKTGDFEISHCYNTGMLTVSDTLSSNCGGIVGAGVSSYHNYISYNFYLKGTCTIAVNSTVIDAGLSGTDYADPPYRGAAITAAQLASEETFADWNFTDIWRMDADAGCPVLRALDTDPPDEPDEPTYEFPSVTALRAATRLQAADEVTTLAYYEGGTNGNTTAGASTYRIESHADWNTSKDDGGRYIKLDDTDLWAILQAKDGTGGGTGSEIENSTVDLFQFGAYGDGIHNDTHALGAAFTSGIKNVHVSAGTYLTQQIDVNPSNGAAEGLSIIGESAETCTFKLLRPHDHFPTSTYVLLSFTNMKNLKLKDIGLCGNTRENTYYSRSDPTTTSNQSDKYDMNHIQLWYCDGVEFDTIRVIDTLTDNVQDMLDVNAGIKFIGTSNLNIHDSVFNNLDCGIITQGSATDGSQDCHDITIDHCSFDGHLYSEPISFYATGPRYSNITLTNNTIRNKPYACGILVIDGNDGLSWPDSGRPTNPNREGYRAFTSYDHVTIANNTMTDIANCIQVSHAKNVTIEGNTSTRAGCLTLSDCKDVTVRNHTAANVGQMGLAMKWANKNVTVSGLSINGYGTIPNEDEQIVFPALDLSGTATNVKISGTVKGTVEAAGANITGSGYDLSGVTFDIPVSTRALQIFPGVTGTTFHTDQNVRVSDSSGNWDNDILIDAVGEVSIEPLRKNGALVDTHVEAAWDGLSYHTTWNATWNNWAENTGLAYMEPNRDGFTRTLVVEVPTGSSTVGLLKNGDGSQGSITWIAGGHTIAKGASESYVLTCENGKWYEQDTHEHVWGNGTVTTPATCTTAGVRTFTCSVCGKARTETIAALGHDWGEWTITKEATASAAGVESRICRNDTSHAETRAIPRLEHAHVWGEGVATTPATCTAEGVQTYTCSVCGETMTAELPALGHSWEAAARIDLEPGCETAGRSSVHCDRCDAVRDVTVLAALGHVWGGWTVMREATCTASGSEARRCLRDDAHVESRDIAMVPHTDDGGRVVREPAVGREGELVHSCSVCGTVLSREAIPALAPEPIRIACPTGQDFYYDGIGHTGVLPGKGYTLSGTWQAVDTGNYAAIAVPEEGYAWEDGSDKAMRIIWRISPVPSTSLLRLFNPATGEHLYTIDESEARGLCYESGWVLEGEAAKIPSGSEIATSSVWRLFNIASGEHLYTADANEYGVLSSGRVWVGEGEAFRIPADAVFGKTSVHRLYNPRAASHTHLYTADASERTALIATGRWTDEGIAWRTL